MGCVLLSLASGLLLASATPLKGSPDSASLQLHRQFSLYQSEGAQGPLPLSVNGIESLVYTVDVQVGSPPQRFNLTLDTITYAPVLFRKGFVSQNQSCSTGDAKRNRFDPSQSRTLYYNGDLGSYYLDKYPYIGTECVQSLGSTMRLDGLWVWDAYQLGALSVPSVPFVLSNFSSPSLSPRWASDGVFPLNFGDSLYYVFLALGGNQEVSLFLNNEKPSDNQPVSGGSITLGSRNTQDCSDKWVTLESDAYWGLPLNSLTVGTWSMDGLYTVLSTATPFLEVPSRYFRPFVVSTLGGTFSDDLDLYTVDCSKVDSLPSMSINLGSGFGLTYTVSGQDYVAKMSGKNGVECALLIVNGDTNCVLGTQFFPKRCVHKDYISKQVGFADPKN